MTSIRTTAPGLLLVFLVACSATPEPAMRVSMFGANSQDVLGGVAHWRIVAEDTASSITDCLDGGSDSRCASEAASLKGKPVYLYATDSVMPFGRAFHGYLQDALLERGIQVAGERRNAVVVQTTAQLLPRDGTVPTGDFPGAATMVASGLVLVDYATAGLVGLGAAFDRTLSQSEVGNGSQVVISTSLLVEGRHVLQRTAGYYVPEVDRQHYVSGAPPALPPVAVGDSAESPPVATLKVVQE